MGCMGEVGQQVLLYVESAGQEEKNEINWVKERKKQKEMREKKEKRKFEMI